MNKKFNVYVMIVLILCTFLLLKIFNIYQEKTPYLFFSHDGFQMEGTRIIKYEGSGNVIIPQTIDGVTVTEIADYAFADLGIDSVIIPDTITAIGSYAFANNNMTRVEIPDSVKTIGTGAFSNNKISSLKMRKGVVYGNACFNNNQLADEDAFFYRVREDGTIDHSEIISYGGKMRSSVIIPESVEKTDLKIIGEQSFADNDIIAITIPKTVEQIKKDAFKNNYLVELYLSNNIKNIAEDAFSNNDYLTEIIIDNKKDNLLNYPWGAQKSNFYWLRK